MAFARASAVREQPGEQPGATPRTPSPIVAPRQLVPGGSPWTRRGGRLGKLRVAGASASDERRVSSQGRAGDERPTAGARVAHVSERGSTDRRPLLTCVRRPMGLQGDLWCAHERGTARAGAIASRLAARHCASSEGELDCIGRRKTIFALVDPPRPRSSAEDSSVEISSFLTLCKPACRGRPRSAPLGYAPARWNASSFATGSRLDRPSLRCRCERPR